MVHDEKKAGIFFVMFATAASTVVICMYEEGTYEEQRCAVVGYGYLSLQVQRDFQIFV